MANEEASDQYLVRFDVVERLLLVETHDGGRPPTIEKVINHYVTVLRFLNWAYNVAELLDYIANQESRGKSPFLDRFHEKLLHLPDDDDELSKLVSEYSTNRISEADGAVNPPPEARILESIYSNPLLTLIVVSAASLVAVMVGGSIAYKVSKKGKVEDAKAKFIYEVAKAASRGDHKTLEELRPVLEGIGKSIEKAVPAKVGLKVGPLEVSAGEQAT
jgi:hypothetical protein